MRIAIFIAFLLVVDWFAFQAFRFLIQGMDKSWRLGFTIAFWSIPVLTIAYMQAGMQGWANAWPRELNVFLRTLIFILYFSKLLIAVVMLVDDFRRVVTWVASQVAPDEGYSTGRSKFLSQLGLGLGALPFLSLTYGMIRNPYRYKVFEQELPVAGLAKALDGLRIVQISDIHSGSFLFKEPVARSVEMINDLKPDVVFFTGDLVNSKADEMDDYIDVFGKIEAQYGVYSICGNHDYGDYHDWPDEESKARNFDYFKEQHKKMGWNLLMNEHHVLEIDNSRLGIIGVENYSANKRFHKYGDLSKALTDMPDADFNVLMSHDPSHWNDQVTKDYQHIDLTLSGHTHGFQFGVEIPGFLKWSPVQYVYKEWAGLYRQGRQFLYVNRGLGYLGYPGRVGILPEITLLTLKTA